MTTRSLALALLAACQPAPNVPGTPTGTGTPTGLITGATGGATTTEVLVAPVAVDDQFSHDEGATDFLDLLGNDDDVNLDMDPYGIVVVTPPQHGTVAIAPGGRMTYAHSGADAPTDSFAYTVADFGGLVSNVATVSIAVILVNDPAVAADDAVTILPQRVIEIDVVANDFDEEGAVVPGTVAVVSLPSRGFVVNNGDGTITYTHTALVGPKDSFTYTVEDDSGVTSAPGTVEVTIEGLEPALVGFYNVNNGPSWMLNPPSYNCLEGCAATFGGSAVDYQCSTNAGSIDNLAYASGYGDATFCTTPVAEDYKLDPGTGYNCGVVGCSYSAYVQDNCFSSFNYCWQ